MKLRFLGGVSEVGPLSIELSDRGTDLLLDHGMLPADPPEYPMRSGMVDIALLSHSHLDHCGMLPSLVRSHDVNILSTHPTLEVVDLLLYDSVKIAEIEGYPKYFDKEDIKRTKASFDIVGYNSKRDIGGMEIELHSAGHIPGSAMYELRGEKTTLFTGDINTINTRLLWGAHPVKCDNLILEATYAGEDHPPRIETEKRLLDDIDETLNRGGQVIIPVFAVGRSQEILSILNDRDYDIWFDGMGRTVNRIYLNHEGFIRDVDELEDATNNVNEVTSNKSREGAKKAEVIVSTSGMVEGGPVVEYIMNKRKDKKSSIFLTGYQVPGTNGNKLLEEGRLEDRGVTVPVECEIKKFDFSAHAGHSPIVDFAKGCDPENIVLIHGDQRELLAEDLSEFNVFIPKEGESLEI